MFDNIQELLKDKHTTHPLFLKVWNELVEQLEPLDIKQSISAFYYTEYGSYANMGILTKTLIVDIEANDKTKLRMLTMLDLKSVGGVFISNLPETLTEPVSTVATGENKHPTLSAKLTTIEGTPHLSWYATEEEEEELRKFIRHFTATRFDH